MIVAFMTLFVLAVFLFIVAFRKNDGSHKKALKISWKTVVNILPLLLIAFIMAGFIEVVIPPELIHQWLGNQAGIKGIFIGSIAGALIPGGPYVAFPIIATIYKAGAGVGTVVAFVVGWAVWGIGNIPYELALIGPRFTALRYLTVLILPPLSGLIAYALF